jgi:PadR family transcriptional regulator, regulatory protein PadR
MGARDHLGEFEILVLLAIMRLGDDAYGMRIRRELEQRGKRSTSIGALYITLERLQSKGFVQSRLDDATPERGGRPKRFFTINADGKKVLRESLNAFKSLAQGLALPGVV